jgi:hypothetical protein
VGPAAGALAEMDPAAAAALEQAPAAVAAPVRLAG